MSYIHINVDELSDDDLRVEILCPPANYHPPSKIDCWLDALIRELYRQNCVELAGPMDRCRKGHRPEQRGASDPRRTFPRMWPGVLSILQAQTSIQAAVLQNDRTDLSRR